MTEVLTIERKRLRFFNGSYRANHIILKQGMSPEEEERTYIHELKHHAFFLNVPIFRAFYYDQFRYPYTAVTFMVALVNPMLFLYLAAPLMILQVEELYTSLTTSSPFSAFTACLSLIVMVSLAFSLI